MQLARQRPRFRWDTWVIALLAYVPFFYSEPGRISADTKAYLYLDPGHLLATAASMWNSDQGFGMVTHQNIGYLFPMGPYYLLFHWLGVSAWIAQRFWMGSLLFLAALGVRRFLEEMGIGRNAAWAAAIPYMLSPYILVNIDRTTAILMPWAGLGWMMLYVVRAARRGGWRDVARFAVVIALVGGVNATSILLVGLAPATWLAYAIFTGEISWTRAITVAAKISALGLLVSLWWIGGLWAEGAYGINILNYTESITTVASTSTTSEVLRGLGYWYFYGSDHIQPWTMASGPYETNALVVAASFFLPAAGILSSLFVRWRYRGYFVAIGLLGIVLAVGAYPISAPAPFGAMMKWLGLHTTVGLAMRSTNRVMPLVLLSFGTLLAAAIHARAERKARSPRRLVIVTVLVSILAIQPLFAGSALAANLSSPSTLPQYVTLAAHDLNQGSSRSTVLGLPGVDFGNYRFGAYVDSLWPGLLSRPFETNQVTPQGENASVDLIRALDSRFQDGYAEPQAIAPIARLFSAGDILLQMDIQYERFNSPTPAYMWSLFSPTPTGLKLVKTYGPVLKDQVSDGRYINEQMLNLPPRFKWPASLAIFRVSGARPLTRSESMAGSYLIAGSGMGLVNLATMGLLNDNHTLWYEGAVSPHVISQLLSSHATLILTDTNAKLQSTFGTLSSSAGYVEALNELPTNTSEEEHALYAFEPGVGNQTVAILHGISAVGASSYGNPIANVPEHMPFYAVDGNPNTSWQTAAFHKAIGEYLTIHATLPHVVSRVHFLQSQNPTENRWITKISISVGNHTYHRLLTQQSWGGSGQWISIPPTRGSTLTITIDDTTPIFLPLKQQSAVGFSEMFAPGFGNATRSLLLPTSLLQRVGGAARTASLIIDMSRIRVAATPPRTDPELTLNRTFVLPYARTFGFRGTAQLYAQNSDFGINAILGMSAGSAGDRIIATSASTRMVGAPLSASRAAFDGSPLTAWQNAFQTGLGQTITERLATPLTINQATFTVLNDGRHAVPTSIEIRSGSSTRLVTLPFTLRKGGVEGSTDTATVHFAPLTGDEVTYTIKSIIGNPVVDRITGGVNHTPLGIAEISVPGIATIATPSTINTSCISHVLQIDGRNVPVKISGTLSEVQRGLPLAMSSCEKSLTLSVGTHNVESTLGAVSGFQVDDLVLSSTGNSFAGASAMSDLSGKWTSRSSLVAHVGPSDVNRVLVLGQSMSAGWTASLNGVSLGQPVLVDGASTGWILPSHIPAHSTVIISWAPQRTVNYLLITSAVGLVFVLLLACGRRRGDQSPLDGPVWRSDRVRTGRPHPMAIVLALASGVLVAWWAPFVLAAILFCCFVRRSWNWFSVASMISLGVSVLLTIYATLRSFPQDISWPTHIHFADSCAAWALVFWVCAIAFAPHRPREDW